LHRRAATRAVHGRTNGHVGVGVPTCVYDRFGADDTFSCNDVWNDHVDMVDQLGTVYDGECNEYTSSTAGNSGGPIVLYYGVYLAHALIKGSREATPHYLCYSIMSYAVWFSNAEIWNP
jgi:hypothetical protein